MGGLVPITKTLQFYRQSFGKVAQTKVPPLRKQTARLLRVGKDSTHSSLPVNDTTTISADTKQTVNA
jgi:hypothetical protein